ncbi:hypothetical protein F2P56_030434 [Juglans regia]|uniref:Metallo-beta-lactamase domain-containing protein n=2 Tax=Juglans regia TaxID=51240 RepID=A0A833WHT2_JUGRE|nr:uncharacterized protein LOC118343669 isoform X1 [Juglans regia]KAF5450053.1 hypothetical protein F2P56_030434 [Juglans regia]
MSLEMAMAVRLRSTRIPPCSSSMLSLSSVRVPMGFTFNTNSSASRIPFLKAIRSSQAQASASTVSLKQRRPQNVDGEFFVDHTCIDCDTCQWMAPQIFTRVDEQSAVLKQPTCEEERLKALQALISCPTSSIRTEKPPPDILTVQKTFPLPIDEQRVPGVYHCGYHSEKSYGAASYLIVHPEGNILIDSPRFTERLASNIEKLGGARYMFLTHKDDIADHERWSKRLKCDRILHSLEVEDSTTNVEIKLEGSGPWSLFQDIQLIHTPGHTDGSVCLFYTSLDILFTGDHLFMTESGLAISEKFNFYSVPIQLNNVRILLDLDFKWVLPGHGRRVEFKDYQEKNSTLEAFLQQKSSQLL